MLSISRRFFIKLHKRPVQNGGEGETLDIEPSIKFLSSLILVLDQSLLYNLSSDSFTGPTTIKPLFDPAYRAISFLVELQ